MDKELLKKYRPYRPSVRLENRTWPDNEIVRAPAWCSVDLRDGNQALILPMTLEEKLEMFHLLVDIGFREIEVGFPSASDVEYRFLRKLIDDNLIPSGVRVQVLTQAREHLVKRTFEAIEGAPDVILHLYNSTSELQRRIVFGKDRDEIRQLAVDGVSLVTELAASSSSEIQLEYSPESFTGTETEYALEVCESVMEAWGASPERKVILNLPATVEMYTPNLYADQIEWFGRNLKNRSHALISLHAHNDRGTAVAATELALMAGADRVEGTLFGNGERTGNVDIVTLALNMYSHGVDPELDFHDLQRVVELSEKVTKIPVHIRQPYAGELVYTAFSGSHQDAINKGIAARASAGGDGYWEVPYLPVDPEDLGRSYEAIIRINSQSGKGGVAYIMEHNFGYILPKKMHGELGPLVQSVADMRNEEIKPEKVYEIFKSEYLERDNPFKLKNFRHSALQGEEHFIECDIEIEYKGEPITLKASGNGPIDACKKGLISKGLAEFTIQHYSEHALSAGSDAQAVAYIQINAGGGDYFGVGVNSNIEIASIRAIFCALNRYESTRTSGSSL